MSATSDIARQTAMVLCGLPAREREWLLRRLAPARAARLAALIEEVEQLGLEAQGAMMPALIDSLERRAHPEEARAALDLARVDTLCAVLADAPARAMAVLLAAHPWRWREAFMARFAGPQKREVLAALREAEAALPPRLAEALIDALAEQIKLQPQARPAAPRSSLKAFASAFPMLRKTGARR